MTTDHCYHWLENARLRPRNAENREPESKGENEDDNDNDNEDEDDDDHDDMQC